MYVKSNSRYSISNIIKVRDFHRSINSKMTNLCELVNCVFDILLLDHENHLQSYMLSYRETPKAPFKHVMLVTLTYFYSVQVGYMNVHPVISGLQRK